MSEHSEFPETWLSRFGRKLGWLFSPLLLLTLIIATLFFAEGLKVNLDKGSIEKKASIEIKEVKDAKVYINGQERGVTPDLFDIDSSTTNETEVKITKADKKDWNKKLKVEGGFVKTYYPILYPNKIEFTKDIDKITQTYKNNDPQTFFYQKSENNRVQIYKYSLARQIFGIKQTNSLFADITDYVVQRTTETKEDGTTTEISSIKEYKVIPSNNGERLLLLIPNDRVIVIQKNSDFSKLSNIIPRNTDEFLWSPTDSHIIYKSAEEIYSVEISTNRLVVIQRPRSEKEKIEIQFLLDSSLVYKLQNEDYTDLIQNSYEGNEFKNIEIPNINGIRKQNLIKAYNFLSKANLILIQTNSDIYSYNVISYELKKFNLFKGEKILYLDIDKQIALTINTTNPKQFRYYDVEQNESRTFTLESDVKGEPKNITVFNNASNIILEYPNLLIFSDIDGFNQTEIKSFRDPKALLAAKFDDNIQIIIQEQSEVKPVAGTPTPTTIASPTATPEEVIVTPTEGTEITPTSVEQNIQSIVAPLPDQIEYELHVLKFVN